MASSVLFFKEHFRDTDPDFFSFPTVQVGFWDLRDGGMATADNFKTGQIRIRGLNEKLICDELEEFVEKFLEERQGKQRKFLTEIR